MGALLVALFGCGGIDLASETRGDAGEGDGNGGASGTTGGTGTGGASDTTGPTGAGGSSSGGSAGTGGSAGVAGGIPDGAVCNRTFDRAVIRVTKPGGVIVACDAAMLGGFDAGPPTIVTGRVTARTDNSFTVDSCPPNADCTANTITKIDVNAPGLVMPRFPTFVRVEYAMSRIRACQQSLEVTNLATWYGMVNPGIPDGTLLLAVADGGGPFADSPYTVERVRLGCDVDAGRGCGGDPPGDYAFQFSWKGDSRTTRVEMGDTGTFDAPSTPMVRISARNLRSYQTDNCDDYWNFAYYLVAQPITP